MKIMGQLILTGLSEDQEMRMNLLCATTRNKRDITKLMRELPTLNRSGNTVFGEFGAEGEYLIPNIRYFMELLPVMPKYQLPDKCLEVEGFDHTMKIHTAEEDQGILPAGCPCAKLPFRFVHRQNKFGTCMVWDGQTDCDDPFGAALWLAYVLEKMGEKFVGGKMAYIRNKTLTTITVGEDGELSVEGKPGSTIRKKDYEEPYPELSPKPARYAIIYDAEILRNTERFTGSNVNDEDAIYDDSLWELEEGMAGFAGTVPAFSEDEALEIAAKQFKCKKKHLTVFKLA